MKISTKRGDKGESGLYNGRRERKSALVFDVLGDLDELNSFLGFCRPSLENERMLGMLERVQEDIYRMMSVVGSEMGDPRKGMVFEEEDVKYLEEEIEHYEALVGDLRKFVRPGEKEGSARLHLARVVCRRAERSLVKLAEKMAVPEILLKYLNRLSDLLFIAACKIDS